MEQSNGDLIHGNKLDLLNINRKYDMSYHFIITHSNKNAVNTSVNHILVLMVY